MREPGRCFCAVVVVVAGRRERERKSRGSPASSVRTPFRLAGHPALLSVLRVRFMTPSSPSCKGALVTFQL